MFTLNEMTNYDSSNDKQMEKFQAKIVKGYKCYASIVFLKTYFFP